ncbi:MAG: T9SS C-terminal target domain-containing protein [Bacteroidetes bacterium]|nr:MAG: T9SS C-terminal target domain-containing protein [Bacteroidota bacterium]
MRRISLLAIFILSYSITFAQLISVNARIKSVEGKIDSVDSKSAQVVIRNNSTNPQDTNIRWTIIKMERPTGWQIDFCDPWVCIANQGQGSTGTFVLKSGASAPLKADFYAKSNFGGTATMDVLLTFVNGTVNNDTFTLSAKGWNTSVSKVHNQPLKLEVFPNPASSVLNVTYNASNVKAIKIFNMLGSLVYAGSYTGGQKQIDIKQLNSGKYFIQVITDDNVVSKTFIKSE